MFNILFVDDELHEPMEYRLRDMLGPSGEYASWAVLRLAGDAVQGFINGRCPDVAVIDMRLKGSDRDEYVGEKEDYRGYYIAAALNHYSAGKARWVIYTGNHQLKIDAPYLFAVPDGLKTLGVEPLIKVRDKANPNTQAEVEALLKWAKDTIHDLARQKIRELDVRPEDLETVVDCLCRVETAWLLANELKAKFENDVGPKIVEVSGWWQHHRARLEGAGEWMADDLALAKDVTEIVSAAATAVGAEVGQALAPLVILAEQFQTGQIGALQRAERDADHILGEFQASSTFKRLRQICPFEAQIIQRADNPALSGSRHEIIDALRDMLGILRENDRHFALFRTLKRVDRGGKEVCLTCFAQATHQLMGKLEYDDWPVFLETWGEISESRLELRRLREVTQVCFPKVTQAVCS